MVEGIESTRFEHLDFEFVSDFEIRDSDFEFDLRWFTQ